MAVKFLHGSKEMEAEVQNRFVREVALLERLEHENIIRMFEARLHDGSIYCAMELVECGTLSEILASRGQLPCATPPKWPCRCARHWPMPTTRVVCTAT
ncbi:MAG TPA: hypothetical protein DHW22_04315 [Planctomycetaceae bacterium]|nr:hypothetical protein [Planctomycetaceae bacterium]